MFRCWQVPTSCRTCLRLRKLFCFLEEFLTRPCEWGTICVFLFSLKQFVRPQSTGLCFVVFLKATHLSFSPLESVVFLASFLFSPLSQNPSLSFLLACFSFSAVSFPSILILSVCSFGPRLVRSLQVCPLPLFLPPPPCSVIPWLA